MGSSDSKASSAEFGTIIVQCPKAHFTSGEQVDGVVYLSVLKPYEGTNVVLNITGRETSRWTETQGSGDNRHQVTYQSSKITLSKTFKLFTFPEVIAGVGQYAFPFSFLLPRDLAGSVYYSTYGRTGTITYTIEAKLESNNQKLKPIVFQSRVIIKEPLHNEIKSVSTERSRKLTCFCFCCISKGVTAIKCTADKDAYMPGETAKLTIEIDNSQCKLAVIKIKCDLRQKTFLSAGTYGRMFESGLVTNRVEKRIESGQKLDGADSLHVELTLPMEKLDETTSGGITPSSNGTAVKIKYSIDLILFLNGCICGQNPTTTMDVQVYSSCVQPNYHFNVPAEWNLQQMPVSTWAVGDMQYNNNLEQMSPNQMSPGYMIAPETQKLNSVSPLQQQQFGENYF